LFRFLTAIYGQIHGDNTPKKHQGRENDPTPLYGRSNPQPSPLMLRYPFAGQALGLGDLVGAA